MFDMQDISTTLSIDQSRLDGREYMASLMAAALECGILSQTDAQRISGGLMALLQQQTDLLTAGRSSSVQVTRAQGLMASAAYAIGIELKHAQTADDAARLLASVPLKELHAQGIRRIKKEMGMAKLMQKRILSRLFPTPNHFYRGTIEGGVNGFFKLYRPQFGAQETHITADYPVCIGKIELCGIEFMVKYLSCIDAENAFMCRFDPEKVHRMMLSESREYADCPLNLFEPVFACAVGLMLLRRDPTGLDLSHADVSRLEATLSAADEADAVRMVSGAGAALSRGLELGSAADKYIGLCAPRIAQSMLHAAKSGIANRIFLTPWAFATGS